MVLPLRISSPKARRLGRGALTALLVGAGATAIAALPPGGPAFAGNGNGGGHGHDGGRGGQGNGGGQGGSHDGAGGGGSGKSGAADASSRGASDDSADSDAAADDDSLSPHDLGKLNGFLHASPSALANASPNSAIGRISHTLKDALSDFAKASQATTDDPSATPTDSPSIQDLGGILAQATNKKVTAAQVKAVIDRLAEQNPDDAALNDLADTIDAATCQDIADAANASRSGETGVDDGTDDAGAAATTATD